MRDISHGVARRGGQAFLLSCLLAPALVSADDTLPELIIPSHCVWAINELYAHQRSGKRNMSAHEVNAREAADYVRIRPHLPQLTRGHALRLVDIGAGLGMYHTFIARHYGGHVQHFLVDKTAYESLPASTSTLATSGWHADDRAPGAQQFRHYNSMECARDINVANGVMPSRWHFVDPAEEAVKALGTSSVDFAMSHMSLGFHYPVTAYSKSLFCVLKPGGTLLLTVRNGRKQDELLRADGFACNATNANRKASYLLCVRRHLHADSASCDSTRHKIGPWDPRQKVEAKER